MAIAGRVAIVPKGDWSAGATYKRLDAVTYNNTLYFAKKDVPAGTATTNTEYWSKSIVGNPDKSSDQQGQNLISYPYYSKSNTNNGITWTVNEDGTVTANGTATKESAFNIISPFNAKSRKTLELNQKYVLSDGTSDKTKAYTQFVRFNASKNTYDYGISSSTGYNTWTASDKNLLSYGIRLIVANGATVNNVVFKPMLEVGTMSHEYQPTTISNTSLNERLSDQQGQNLIPYPYDGTEGNTNGITWTVNDDGSVTANGTASKEAPYSLIYPYNLSTMKSLQLGNTYIISDGLTDEQHTNVGYMQLVRYDKNNPTNWKYEVSSMKGTEIYTANDENTLQYGIRLIIRNGATANNITFKPMLEVGTMSHEYQPTTLSNPTLKKEIGSALQPESIVNNQTTTVAGFALDARQANPNIDGSLAKQISDLNGSLNAMHMDYRTEVITCQAETMREYIFPNLPDHILSFPLIVNAESSMIGCAAYRDIRTTGKVKVYSPITQNVHVALILLK